jgi:hypothetical protein
MEFYYAATLFLMIGCGFMSFHIGRKEGVIKFLEYLEDHSNKEGIITVKITETEFTVLK